MQEANRKYAASAQSSHAFATASSKSEKAFSRTSDGKLVHLCLDGNEEAWSILVDKYRNLIFSIPLRYGFSAENASGIVQRVFFALLVALPGLREERTLAAWLITAASNECVQWQKRQPHAETEPRLTADDIATSRRFVKVSEELRREQMLREAVADLSPRCHDVVDMLLFTTPLMTCAQFAARLGIEKVSIDFVGMRCLKQLRQRLESVGF